VAPGTLAADQKIQPCSGLDCFSDVGAADARDDFEKVIFDILVGFDELGVSDPAKETQGLDQIPVHFLQFDRVFRFTRD
jgi:hypothetical protein